MEGASPQTLSGITTDTPALANVFLCRSFRNFTVHLSHSENLERVSLAKSCKCARKPADENDLIEKSHGSKALNSKIFISLRRRNAKT